MYKKEKDNFMMEDENGKINIIISINKNYKEKNKSKPLKIKIYEIEKRVLDLVFSLIGIIILSPFFLLISLLIKFENEGRVIFSQRRIGKDGKIFKIYKFRSMKENAPHKSDRDFKDSNLYMTKVGKIIRKMSIDELPQLINILKGEMSFVGPRPFIINEGEINFLRAKKGIHSIVPGLTGWAQINDRNSDNHKQKLVFDLYYLENRSIYFDFKIIIKTFGTSLGR